MQPGASPMTNIDAMSIIRNLKKFQSSVFDQDFNGSGASIDSILNQFF